MSIMRRNFLQQAVLGPGIALGGLGLLEGTFLSCGKSAPVVETATQKESVPCYPDPIFEKPAPITLAELTQRKTPGVSAVEVTDYAPGRYKGELKPSPPHADHNPKKAIIVVWKDQAHRMVFSHEASYDPWIELPDGAGLCNQFFEGNDGYAELFNNNGRKERNSFVDIVQSGPERVWVRWNYLCVNKDDDSHPVLRGTEDYITHPNGLVWRRLTYTSLLPDKNIGYSWQPIDFFSVAPTGTTWKDLFPQDQKHGDYLVGSVLDAYSSKQYDVYWDDNGKARRQGDAQLLLDISHSKGFAMVMPFKEGYLFTIMGAPSGFPSEKSQIVDHSFNDTGGWGWGSQRWDHWPVGWLNAQEHDYKPGSPYPYSFGPFSHYIVNKPLKDGKKDYFVESKDMDLNRWSEKHVYYTLTGAQHDLESIRALAKQWLDKGADCARPESIVNLA